MHPRAHLTTSGEIVRQNMTEGQAGVPLEISVDFIDINNCEPLSNYWIDMWQVNCYPCLILSSKH